MIATSEMKRITVSILIGFLCLFMVTFFMGCEQKAALPAEATIEVQNDLTVVYQKDGDEYVACKSNILVGYRTTDQLLENYICEKESVFITRDGLTIMGNVSVDDYTPAVGQDVTVKIYFSLVDPIHRSTTTYPITDCEIAVGNGLWERMTSDVFTFTAKQKGDVNVRCVTETTAIQANFTVRTGE